MSKEKIDNQKKDVELQTNEKPGDDEEKTRKARHPFNVMTFPNGPICNLDCEYCYYLDKTKYYPGNNSFRMSEDLLEEFTKQYINAQPGPYVNFGWQGGEPTLRGLDFFKKAVELQQKYLPEDWQCENSFQTNATILDDEWCKFLSENNFLVGVSIDGPAWIHDHYRKDNKGNPTHAEVVRGIKLMQKHGVEYNILCVINDLNSQHSVEVYDFFKEIGAEHIQFIPIVEPVCKDSDEYKIAGKRSVRSEEYGRFLIGVFDEWVKKDLGKIFIQIFEQAVTAWAGYPPSLCVFSETCGNAPVMEHNGDFYSCDHFVFPENKLGNIEETQLVDMVLSKKQQEFGNNKRDGLPQSCLDCEVYFICHGGCPKNRIIKDSNGEEGRNYLCAGYKQFFRYIEPYMEEIANRIKKRQAPNFIRKEMVKIQDNIWDVGRNDPCPCGSGKKYKKCCRSRKES